MKIDIEAWMDERRSLLGLHDHREDLDREEVANLLLTYSEQVIDS